MGSGRSFPADPQGKRGGEQSLEKEEEIRSNMLRIYLYKQPIYIQTNDVFRR